MEQLSPTPPPQSNDEGAKEQKRAILKWERGGPDVPFILSKIVALIVSSLFNRGHCQLSIPCRTHLQNFGNIFSIV